MSVIDFHTHTFENSIAEKAVDKLRRNANIMNYAGGTDDELIRANKEDGISLSVVLPVATKATQAENINLRSERKNQDTHKTGLLFFGAIHPEDSDIRNKLSDIKNRGFLGIKIHPVYQNTDADDINYQRLVAAASELDLIISIHAGMDHSYPGNERASIKKIIKLLETVKPEKMVLAHMGGINEWDIVESDVAGSNVFLDTSFCLEKIIALSGGQRPDTEIMSKEQFYRIVNLHGSDKILFGTDSPWSDRKEALSIIKNLDFNEDTKAHILFNNAEKLLKIK